MPADLPVAAPDHAERDPFADDVLERLLRSDVQYQQTHGHYIVPLSGRLLAARSERAALLAERQQDAKRIERLETALEQIVSAGSERAALSDAATASDNPIVRREATRIRSAFVTAVDDARAALAGEEDAPARVRPNETREIVYECRGVALPERIAVDQAGTYWRDLGPFLSLVPHKHGNENATIVAEYRLTITPGMKLRAAVEEDTTP